MGGSSYPSSDMPELPRLHTSCIPCTAERSTELTRWQRLRALAQTKDQRMSAEPPKHTAADGGLYPMGGTLACGDHGAEPGMPSQHLAVVLRQPGQHVMATARSLLRSQHASPCSDSLDADMQVEAVLRKAAHRAACLAGLPMAALAGSGMSLANTQLNLLQCEQQVCGCPDNVGLIGSSRHTIITWCGLLCTRCVAESWPWLALIPDTTSRLSPHTVRAIVARSMYMSLLLQQR